MDVKAMEALVQPRAVAVYGASRNPRKIGHAVLDNLRRGGFAGRLLAVNPAADEVLGVASRPRLGGQEEIDLAVVAVPAKQVQEAVRDAAAAGARALVVVSAGFKESGPAGAEREQWLRGFCKDRHITLLGPKSLGVINTGHRMNASFARNMPSPGRISVLSDSGAVCTAILDWAAARHLGLAKVLSIGNKAGLDEIAVLRYLAGDDDTGVVLAYLESIASGEAFVKAAEHISACKPVVVFHAGASEQGARAAELHTGNRPGADLACVAAFRRAGLIQADSLEALTDHAAALTLQPLCRGRRVAVLSNGGGPGVAAADALEKAGLKLARLSEHTRAELARVLPAHSAVDNPIDLLGDADPERYAQAVELARADEGVDALLAVLTPHAMTRPAETARAVARAAGGGQTTVVVLLGSADMLPGRAEFVASGLPDYPTPERAVAVLRAMVELHDWRNRPPRVVTRFPVNRRRVERLLLRQRRLGGTEVGEVRAKAILRAYGFDVPAGVLVTEREDAVEAAERLGYPGAMKIVSPDVVHKSDVGGVRLSVSDPEQVLDSFDLLTLRVQRHAPGARLEGLYLERMCPRGVEVVLGMRRDPQFGPILLFGLGGIFVEELEDVAAGLAPITADEAVQMLTGTRSYQMLARSRGAAEIDLDELAGGLQRISQLATDVPSLAELEINPFTLLGKGRTAMVVDARMSLLEQEP